MNIIDNYYEQLVTTYKTFVYNLAYAGIVGLGVLGVLLFPIMMIIAIIFIAIAVGLYFLKKRLYVEYEYIFTNGDIDIDVIYEKNKRKRIASFSIKEIELLAPLDSDDAKHFSNKPEYVLKAYPKTSKERQYIAMITGGSRRMQFIFVPNEKFRDLCFKYNPKAVKRFI